MHGDIRQFGKQAVAQALPLPGVAHHQGELAAPAIVIGDVLRHADDLLASRGIPRRRHQDGLAVGPRAGETLQGFVRQLAHSHHEAEIPARRRQGADEIAHRACIRGRDRADDHESSVRQHHVRGQAFFHQAQVTTSVSGRDGRAGALDWPGSRISSCDGSSAERIVSP